MNIVEFWETSNGRLQKIGSFSFGTWVHAYNFASHYEKLVKSKIHLRMNENLILVELK